MFCCSTFRAVARPGIVLQQRTAACHNVLKVQLDDIFKSSRHPTPKWQSTREAKELLRTYGAGQRGGCRTPHLQVSIAGHPAR